MSEQVEFKMPIKSKIVLSVLSFIIIFVLYLGIKLNSKLIIDGVAIFLGLNLCLSAILACLLRLNRCGIIESYWLKKILYQASVFVSGKEYSDLYYPITSI